MPWPPEFFNDPAVDNPPGTHDGVRYAQATVRRMLGTIDLVTKGMWIATLLFALAGVLLISTTVRLSIFSRRHEVEIMRLVGATNWFIRWPFMLEGFITGLVGSVLAAVAIYLLNLTIFNWIRSSAVNFLKVELYPVWFSGGRWPLGLLPTLVIMGAVLGALGRPWPCAGTCGCEAGPGRRPDRRLESSWRCALASVAPPGSLPSPTPP